MNASHLQEEEVTWRQVLIESWIGLGSGAAAVALMFYEWLTHGEISHEPLILIGALSILSMVLVMNGLGRTDIIARQHRDWWKNHPIAKWAHVVSGEDVLAGIIVGSILIASFEAFSGHSESMAHHVPFGMPLTLFGIMSGAALIWRDFVPLLKRIEIMAESISLGRQTTIFVGSLGSSILGEPGAAQVIGPYFAERTPVKNRTLVGTALAGTIGSGGALLPTSAPPILIVWAGIAAVGWTIGDLVFYVGLAATIQVGLISLMAARHIEHINTKEPVEPINWLPILLFGVLVAGHILPGLGLMSHHFLPIVYLMDGLVGMLNIGTQYKALSDSGHKLDEHSFNKVFQPLMLAILLVVLDLVGVIARPFIEWLGHGAMEFGLIGLPLIIGLWALTAVVSAFADNALASVVIVALPLSVMTGMEQTLGVAAVLMGALYGGILLPPSNLPNFALKEIFNIGDDWIKGSVKYLPTGIVYPATLSMFYFMFV